MSLRVVASQFAAVIEAPFFDRLILESVAAAADVCAQIVSYRQEKSVPEFDDRRFNQATDLIEFLPPAFRSLR